LLDSLQLAHKPQVSPLLVQLVITIANAAITVHDAPKPLKFDLLPVGRTIQCLVGTLGEGKKHFTTGEFSVPVKELTECEILIVNRKRSYFDDDVLVKKD